MKYPLVVAVILNYNRSKDTIECVMQLKHCSYNNLIVIVVDNASSDGSEAELHAHLPLVKFLQTGKNLGYTGGINAGIQYALSLRPEYILILNNDTVIEPDFLSHLVNAMEDHNSAAAACGTIYYHPDRTKVWYAGGRMIPWRGLAVHHKKTSKMNNSTLPGVQKVSFITGCLVFLRASALDKIGLEDERFFMYLDDIELSARILRRGFDLLYVPNAVIYHKVFDEGQNAFKLYYSVRNRLLLINIAFNGWKKLTARIYFLFVITLKLIFWTIVKPKFSRATRFGLIDYFKGHFYEGRGIAEFTT